jgi:hypothetical protein
MKKKNEKKNEKKNPQIFQAKTSLLLQQKTDNPPMLSWKCDTNPLASTHAWTKPGRCSMLLARMVVLYYYYFFIFFSK